MEDRSMRKDICMKKLAFIIILGWFVLGMPAQAASFDCDKTGTKVEKSICLNSELSELDEILNVAYRRGLITSLNEKELKESQQKWLAKRNRCPDEKCLAALYWNRVEWLSKQPRAPMQYKLVMSQDDSVCSPALDSFNKHLNEEYPLQPPAFTPTNYRKHVPAEISPQWREGPSKGRSWVTELDLDWDGKAETILKEWSLDRRERKNTGLDVMLDVVPKPAEIFSDRLSYLKTTFPPGTYFLQRSYNSGSFGKPLYDKTHSPQTGVTGIEAEQFDVLLVKGKAYLTFVSNDLGEDFFEDWSKRKWRIISQYLAYENSKSIRDKRSRQDRLKDICYFVLIKNLANEDRP